MSNKDEPSDQQPLSSEYQVASIGCPPGKRCKKLADGTYLVLGDKIEGEDDIEQA